MAEHECDDPMLVAESLLHQRYFDAVKDETVALHVDTDGPGHVVFQTLSAVDAVATVLDREDVARLWAQLGAWLEATPE